MIGFLYCQYTLPLGLCSQEAPASSLRLSGWRIPLPNFQYTSAATLDSGGGCACILSVNGSVLSLTLTRKPLLPFISDNVGGD